jgi:hypothetical protein
MIRSKPFLIIAAGTLAILVFHRTMAAPAPLAPLPVVLPGPYAIPTPPEVYSGPNVEPPPDDKYKGRPAFLAPPGFTNVALGKKVTTSAKQLFRGALTQITDGKKEAYEEDIIELPKGKQWVQIDLEKKMTISAIILWHDYRELQVFHGVVVQVADDADFTQNVRTLFNNDFENKSGLGLGTAKEYFENREGRLIDAQGMVARYIRCYSYGGNRTAWNIYEEVEVYGAPAGN